MTLDRLFCVAVGASLLVNVMLNVSSGRILNLQTCTQKIKAFHDIYVDFSTFSKCSFFRILPAYFSTKRTTGGKKKVAVSYFAVIIIFLQ